MAYMPQSVLLSCCCFFHFKSDLVMATFNNRCNLFFHFKRYVWIHTIKHSYILYLLAKSSSDPLQDSGVSAHMKSQLQLLNSCKKEMLMSVQIKVLPNPEYLEKMVDCINVSVCKLMSTRYSFMQIYIFPFQIVTRFTIYKLTCSFFPRQFQ